MMIRTVINRDDRGPIGEIDATSTGMEKKMVQGFFPRMPILLLE
jgi:hypothetical protein